MSGRPLEETDLADRALGLGVVGIGVQDRLVCGAGGVEVAVVEMRAGLLDLRVELFGLVGFSPRR